MNFDWQSMLYSIPAVIIGLTLHEFAHAFAAFKLGDATAKEEGRLTLNPLKHIDPIGMLFIIIAGFGWARPVRFSPERLSHPRRDRILIALAGPATNLVLGILFLLAIKLLLAISLGLGLELNRIAFNILIYIALINLGLFAFNILPLPPLDGSHLLFSGLSMKPETEGKIVRLGTTALFALLFIENRTGIDILPLHYISDGIVGLFF